MMLGGSGRDLDCFSLCMHAVIPSCWGMLVYRAETSKVARMALVGISVIEIMSIRC